ncbi:gamma carbonic anhydrase family protein [Paraburkholderia caledonica]|uniref:gamma carbonic anhydrase family protein n=1 Tax=Paraburkholderia caledonica TaxID=134536 RepID=UPI000B3FAFCB|nr:gamma carbonic anhydrase family protein [Paraburkholderia caledonica]
MPIYELHGRRPEISPSAYIFENAVIIGDVALSDDVSIWSGVTIRGDNDAIVIERGSNVQEGSVLHVDPECPLHIGPDVTVGHQAMLHGCTIGEGSLIGIGAVVLNKAKVGRNCLIGAGAIIPEGREIPDCSLVIGIGKILRELSAEEIVGIQAGTASYIEKGRLYRTQLRRIA